MFSFGSGGARSGRGGTVPGISLIHPEALYDINFTTGQWYGALPSNLVVSRAADALTLTPSGQYVNYPSNTARITGSGLLPEEARTNQIRNSSGAGAVAGTPGTLPTNWSTYTTLTGLTRQVVGTGTESGLNYVDIKISGTPSAPGNYGIYFDTPTGIAASTGQTFAMSAFASVVSGSISSISSVAFIIDENTSGGLYVTNKIVTTLSLTGSLARFSGSTTLNGGGTVACAFPWLRLTLTGGAIDITIRIAAPQLEQASAPLSPILTTSSALTRPADSIYLPVSGVGTEYTVYHETPVLASYVAQGSLVEMWASSNDRARVANVDQTSQAITLITGGTSRLGLAYLIAGSGVARKSAMRIQAGNIRLAVNGALSAVATGAAPVVAPTRAYLGSGNAGGSNFLNDYLRRIAIIPRALSDAELQAITT